MSRIENNILRAGPETSLACRSFRRRNDVENGFIEFELNDTGDIISGKWVEPSHEIK